MPVIVSHRPLQSGQLLLIVALLWGIFADAPVTFGRATDRQTVAARNPELASHPLRIFERDRQAADAGPSGTPSSAVAIPSGKSSKGSTEALPIQRPSQSHESGSKRNSLSAPRSSSQAVTTVLSALAIVLGAFFLLIWITRSVNKRRWSALPSEAVQLLGRAPLAGKQWMQLIRVGNKLVVVSVNSNQVDTITEITDSAEVEQLLALCQTEQPNNIRQTFQQVLNKYSQNRRDPSDVLSPRHETVSSFLHHE